MAVRLGNNKFKTEYLTSTDLNDTFRYFDIISTRKVRLIDDIMPLTSDYEFEEIFIDADGKFNLVDTANTTSIFTSRGEYANYGIMDSVTGGNTGGAYTTSISMVGTILQDNVILQSIYFPPFVYQNVLSGGAMSIVIKKGSSTVISKAVLMPLSGRTISFDESEYPTYFMTNDQIRIEISGGRIYTPYSEYDFSCSMASFTAQLPPSSVKFTFEQVTSPAESIITLNYNKGIPSNVLFIPFDDIIYVNERYSFELSTGHNIGTMMFKLSNTSEDSGYLVPGKWHNITFSNAPVNMTIKQMASEKSKLKGFVLYII